MAATGKCSKFVSDKKKQERKKQPKVSTVALRTFLTYFVFPHAVIKCTFHTLHILQIARAMQTWQSNTRHRITYYRHVLTGVWSLLLPVFYWLKPKWQESYFFFCFSYGSGTTRSPGLVFLASNLHRRKIMVFVEQPMSLLRSAIDRVCVVGESLFFQGQQSAAHWQYIQKYRVQKTTEYYRTL